MSKKINIRYLYLFFLLFSFIIPVSIFAQQGPLDAYQIHLEEAYPSPGEVVNAQIRSVRESVANIRSVRWYVNGDEQEKFANQLKIPITNTNSPKQIVADVVYFDALNQRRFVRLIQWVRPVIFDIMWEGDVVTIPGYRGHHLVGIETPINISSKIQFIDSDGTLYTEKDFSFRWEIETSFHDDIGPGISHVVYTPGPRHSNDSIFVKTEATLINRNDVLLEKSINIPVTKPKLLVYRHTLLGGLSDNVVVSNQEVLEEDAPNTFSVYPFFFSKADFEKNAIQYRWFVNNNTNHQKEGRKVDISVSGNNISIPIRLSVENENKSIQNIQRSFSIGL